MMAVQVTWSEDEIECVAGRLRDGFSASQIAREISRQFRPVTRNAIIGVVTRNAYLREIGFARKSNSGSRPRQSSPAGRKSSLRTARRASSRVSPSSRSSVPRSSPARTAGAILFESEAETVPAHLPETAPHVVAMPFLRAATERRCLFPLDLLADDCGPEMPVCGAPIPADSPVDGRYCTWCSARSARAA